jgi:hypothetical protein
MAHNFGGRNYGYGRYGRKVLLGAIGPNRNRSRSRSNNSNFPWPEFFLLCLLLIPVFMCIISSFIKNM